MKAQTNKWDFLIILVCVISTYLGNAIMASNLDISEVLDTGAAAPFAITGIVIISYLRKRFGS